MFNNKLFRKKEKQKFTFIIVPSDETDRTKNFVFGKFGIIAIITAFFLINIFIAFILIAYTPLGQIIPVSNAELENKYNKRIVQVQEKLNTLIKEIVLLRQYNLQLRKALGEKIDQLDTISTNSNQNALTAKDLEKPDERGVEVEAFDFNNENISKNGLIDVKSDYKDVEIEMPLIKPAIGLVTRGFSPQDGHLGIDISGKTGSIIYAPSPGTVIFANWTYNYGNILIIAHSSGYRTVYKHNYQLLRTEGEFVKRGDPIAIMGNTGSESTGPHLHFEIWKDGNALNPEKFFLNINN